MSTQLATISLSSLANLSSIEFDTIKSHQTKKKQTRPDRTRARILVVPSAALRPEHTKISAIWRSHWHPKSSNCPRKQPPYQMSRRVLAHLPRSESRFSHKQVSSSPLVQNYETLPCHQIRASCGGQHIGRCIWSGVDFMQFRFDYSSQYSLRISIW